MAVTQIIGWTSSAVLLLTIGQQVWKQWKDGSSDGISRWLFVGQLAASAGFTVYSVLQGDWVFVGTNSMMVANALVGWVILQRNRRRKQRQAAASGGKQQPVQGVARRP